MRTLYYSLIYPYLNYGNIIYGQYTYPSRLESIWKLQKEIVRAISFLYPRDHASPIFENLSILPIDGEAIVLFAFKFFAKALPITFKDLFLSNNYFHNHKTRSSFKIHKEQARTNYKRYSIRFKGCEIWNNLPIFIKNSESFNIFKKRI